jgi:hypothetical protein
MTLDNALWVTTFALIGAAIYFTDHGIFTRIAVYIGDYISAVLRYPQDTKRMDFLRTTKATVSYTLHGEVRVHVKSSGKYADGKHLRDTIDEAMKK